MNQQKNESRGGNSILKKATLGLFFGGKKKTESSSNQLTRNDPQMGKSKSHQQIMLAQNDLRSRPQSTGATQRKEREDEKNYTVYETVIFNEDPVKSYQHKVVWKEDASKRDFFIDEEFLYDGEEDQEKIYTELRRKSLRQKKIEEEEDKLSESIRDGQEKQNAEEGKKKEEQKAKPQQEVKKEQPKKLSEAYKKIKKFLDTSPAHERLDFTQNMLRMAQQLGKDLTISGLLPALQHLAKDNRDIKAALIDQLLPLINYLSDNTDSYSQATEHIMPLLNDFIYDRIEFVRDKAIKILPDFCQSLNQEDRGNYILTCVLKLAHENEDENARASALKVLNKLAEFLDIQLIEKFIVIEVSALGQDEFQVVRQAVAENLLNICKQVSQDCFLTKILPLFEGLSKDKDPQVRKACAEQIPDISEVCPVEYRQRQFTQLYSNYIKDNAKAVRESSYEHLGRFLVSLKGLEINEFLVDSFLRMADNSNKDIQFFCAYNFPALLFTLGCGSWDHVKKVYLKLAKTSDPRIKRTLAFSIHEIAKILGQEDTEDDLLPIIKQYLRDGLKEVRIGAMKGIPDFINNVNPENRLQFLDYLTNEETQKDWRMKVIVAKNMGKVALLLPPLIVKERLLGYFYKFSQERTYTVRKACSKNLQYFLEKFTDDKEQIATMVNYIRANFLKDQSYWKRVTFIFMMKGVMQNSALQDVFLTNFIDEFVALGNDRVPNVRIVMARVLKHHFENSGQFIFDLKINGLVKLLKKDKIKDVVLAVGPLQTFPLNETEEPSPEKATVAEAKPEVKEEAEKVIQEDIKEQAEEEDDSSESEDTPEKKVEEVEDVMDFINDQEVEIPEDQKQRPTDEVQKDLDNLAADVQISQEESKEPEETPTEESQTEEAPTEEAPTEDSTQISETPSAISTEVSQDKEESAPSSEAAFFKSEDVLDEQEEPNTSSPQPVVSQSEEEQI